MIRCSTYVERSSVTLGAFRSHNHVNLSVELQIGIRIQLPEGFCVTLESECDSVS
jgi:hypothetical protein